MTAPHSPAGTRLATRLAFLAAGFAMACWAPLVPFAKARVGATEAEFGLILLGLGVGSLLAMPLTGWLSARWGSKPMILAGGLGLVALLPLLAVADDARTLTATLLGFGAALGTIDVAMNIHAVEVERRAGGPLMSNFHAMFSIGGMLGAGGLTLLLGLGLRPQGSALLGAGLTLAAVVVAWPRFLPAKGEPVPLARPHGIVILLSALAAAAFLVEGAILDWGALLVIERNLVADTQAGVGYMLFSAAMTVGRLTGDALVARIGNARTLAGGGAVTIGGFALLLLVPAPVPALAGFLAIGLGASNLVPVLFRLVGRQRVMPAGLAVAALTTTGYAGILLGPAGIGFAAGAVGLTGAHWLLAGLMLLFPLCARRVAREAGEE